MNWRKLSANKEISCCSLSSSIVFTAVVLVVLYVAIFWQPNAFQLVYRASVEATSSATSIVQEAVVKEAEEVKEPVFQPIRMETPESVRAIYMTQCVAGTPSFREKLVTLAEETEINSIIIDVKDYTGGLGLIPENPDLEDYLSTRCYAGDMREFVKRLNEKGIYTIARITVFQDPLYSQKYPDQAVQKASDGTIWTDYKGLSFIDVGSQEAWDYILAVSKEAYDAGFDELNFDYVRYPSDGNMKDIKFPLSEDNVVANPDTGKAENLEEFFAYLHDGLKDLDVALSADLFGMVTTNVDDLNIGQQLERALPYFDYIAPMVYPSHFPKGFNGWQNPNNHVYDIIAFSMGRGVERVVATTTSVETLLNPISLSTTTSIYKKEAYKPTVLRPWLQDFDYGGNYGAEEVRAQIQAAYDVGLNSWMLWDPANIYTREALLSNTEGNMEPESVSMTE